MTTTQTFDERFLRSIAATDGNLAILFVELDAARAALDAATRRVEALRAAGLAIYMAGVWKRDGIDSVEDAVYWVQLRDALELAPGTATALGVAAPVTPTESGRAGTGKLSGAGAPMTKTVYLLRRHLAALDYDPGEVLIWQTDPGRPDLFVRGVLTITEDEPGKKEGTP